MSFKFKIGSYKTSILFSSISLIFFKYSKVSIVGPITQKFRDRAAAKEDKSIMQIIEMLTASVNKKRSEQGMEELDRQTVLNNRTNQLEKEETKIQFPGSGVPLDIEDVLDFLTT
jgi:hypothetical protein